MLGANIALLSTYLFQPIKKLNKSIIQVKQLCCRLILRYDSVHEIISALLPAQKLHFIQDKHCEVFLRRNRLGTFGTNFLQLLGKNSVSCFFPSFQVLSNTLLLRQIERAPGNYKNKIKITQSMHFLNNNTRWLVATFRRELFSCSCLFTFSPF